MSSIDEEWFFRYYNKTETIEGHLFYGRDPYHRKGDRLWGNDNVYVPQEYLDGRRSRATWDEERNVTEVEPCKSPVRCLGKRSKDGRSLYPVWHVVSATRKGGSEYMFFRMCFECKSPLTHKDALELNEFLGIEQDTSFMEDNDFWKALDEFSGEA